eukprot:Awhi_evm2s15811
MSPLSKTANSRGKNHIQNRVADKTNSSSDCEWGDWGKVPGNNYNYNSINSK